MQDPLTESGSTERENTANMHQSCNINVPSSRVVMKAIVYSMFERIFSYEGHGKRRFL